MKRLTIYGAGLVLASAAFAQAYYDDSAAVDTGSGYPPCSATITDRCIQLYEPGVATPQNLALNEQLGPDRSAVALAANEVEPVEAYEADYAEAEVVPTSDVAMGGPYEEVYAPEYASSDYPPCNDPYDDRCIQLYERGDGPHWGWY